MKRYDWLLAVLALALISGCAPMQPTPMTAEEKADRTVVTGSHIPSKAGTAGAVTTSSGQSAQDAGFRNANNVPPTSGR